MVLRPLASFSVLGFRFNIISMAYVYRIQEAYKHNNNIHIRIYRIVVSLYSFFTVHCNESGKERIRRTFRIFVLFFLLYSLLLLVSLTFTTMTD